MQSVQKRWHWPAGSLVVGAVLVGTVAAAGAQSFTFTSIDVPGATVTEAQGINDAGQIVGWFRTSESFGSPTHGFRLSGGTFTPIDVPGATVTFANGINNAGQIVGEFIEKSGKFHGFRLSGGTFTPIDVSGTTQGTIAEGINDWGQIVGRFFKAPSFKEHGFRLSGGVLTVIDAPGATATDASGINDSGQIVLDTNVGNFLFRRGRFRRLPPVPGATSTDAFGLNNLGQVVGFFSKAHDPIFDHGFLLSWGIFTIVDVPGAIDTEPFGINDWGQIVGNFSDASKKVHGFLATPCWSRTEGCDLDGGS